MSDYLLNQLIEQHYSAVARNLIDDMIDEGVVVDKRKFRIVFEDETPESVRVKIEPVFNLMEVQI